ncbi:MAG TPA: molecular chaperone TorD family protein [bacterium]
MTQHMTGDRELTQFRQQHYGMFVQLLANEPTSALLEALGRDITQRAEAAGVLHPELGRGWETLAATLPQIDADAATQEFLTLFIGPRQPETTPYESWYLTGQLFQRPLIVVRAFMEQLGLERDEKRFPEPEDVLAFELEIMNWLLTKQLAATTEDEEIQWLDRQQQFLAKHLLVWAPEFTTDLERANSARMYKGVAQLLRGFLAWEYAEFQQRGMKPVESLEDARKKHPQRPRYRGIIADDQFKDPPPGKPI